MGGKRAEAESISQFVGGLGTVTDRDGQLIAPPFWYFELEAARVLGCSYLEIRDAPDKADLMRMAFTYQSGKNKGEYLRELNPSYQKQRKAMGEKIQKAAK
jgi:hypothetical protein